MNNHDQRKHLTNPAHVALALCALAALGGRAAQAQVTFISDPSQLGNNTVKTVQYPMGSASGIVPQTFGVPTTNGSNFVSFTATSAAATPSAGFESFVADATIAPQFTAGDVLEDTTIFTPGGNLPTAPLLINFQNSTATAPSGVGGFGLFAQDFNADMETFTLTVYALPNAMGPALGTFSYNGPGGTTGPTGTGVDNTSSAGTAVFVGAETTLGLPVIESATLSSFSVAAGTNPNNGSNDFYFGPTRILAPVPEASTVVSFGLGVLLFAGLALSAHKRKVSEKSAA